MLWILASARSEFVLSTRLSNPMQLISALETQVRRCTSLKIFVLSRMLHFSNRATLVAHCRYPYVTGTSVLGVKYKVCRTEHVILGLVTHFVCSHVLLRSIDGLLDARWLTEAGGLESKQGMALRPAGWGHVCG